MDIDEDDAFLYGDEPQPQESTAQAQAQEQAQAQAAKESAISASMAAYVCVSLRLFSRSSPPLPHWHVSRPVTVADIFAFWNHSGP